MSIITTCKVLTKSDENENEELALYTEWDDSKAKIFIMRSDESLLKGEILLEDFNKYAKTFDKTLEAYLHEARSILSGDNDDIEFFLKDNKFSWKRKRWYLGQIPVTSDKQVECLRELTVILMDEYLKSKKETVELKKNHVILTNRCSALEEQIKEMIILKDQMEPTIYKQCSLIINTKKAKIRSLTSIIKKNHKDPIFDLTTDESDNDVDVKDKSSDHSSQLNTHAQKRKAISASDENKINIIGRKKRKPENSDKINKSKSTDISKNDNSTKLKTSGEIINKSLSKDIKTSKRDYVPVTSTSEEISIDVLKKKSITSSSVCENLYPKVEIGQKNIEPVPSTSKEFDAYTDTSTKDTELNFTKNANLNCNIGEDDETPDLLDNESCKSDGDESECEVQLQFEEEKFDDSEKQECAIIEDDSEEEMF